MLRMVSNPFPPPACCCLATVLPLSYHCLTNGGLGLPQIKVYSGVPYERPR